MRVMILDTYYPVFLKNLYQNNPTLGAMPYEKQLDYILDQNFGTSDFYSKHLINLGYLAQDYIVNCDSLQKSWGRAPINFFENFRSKIPPRVCKIPFLGDILSFLPGIFDVLLDQVNSFQPNIIFCQDITFIPPSIIKKIKRRDRLLVGQIASPLPSNKHVQSYDLILTSFPHFVSEIKSLGVDAEYFRIGFDADLLNKIHKLPDSIDVSFMGGIGRHHRQSLEVLEYLAENTPIQFYGYGVDSLDRGSPILPRHHGERWGLDMYQVLASSKITINRHINVANKFANNMRLYEATGVGSLLITDQKDNLNEIFEIGKEVISYESKEEAVDLIQYYLSHPDAARKIAVAGQARTLSDHTYAHRMRELSLILKKYI